MPTAGAEEPNPRADAAPAAAPAPTSGVKRTREEVEAADVRSTLGVSKCRFGGARRNTTTTLIDFVCGRFSYYTEAQWRERITQGLLKVDGRLVDAAFPLVNGSTITLDTPREFEPEVDLRYRHLGGCRCPGYKVRALAIEKSGNIPVSPSGKYRKNTLVFEVQWQMNRHAWSVHRLDKETSGCVVFALTEESANHLREVFSTKNVRKVYHAVLRGVMKERTVCDQPVLPKHQIAGEGYCADVVPMRKIRMACAPGGKPCATTFTPLATIAAGDGTEGLTLAEVEIDQGRTHQIRVHAEYLGHALLGDKVYGHGEGSEKQSFAWTTNAMPFTTPYGEVPRHLLHASHISIDLAAGAPPQAGADAPKADDPTTKWAAYSDPTPFFTQIAACAPLFTDAVRARLEEHARKARAAQAAHVEDDAETADDNKEKQ